MRHLKKFLESSQSDLEIIKEYFFNLTDDLDNLCKVDFFENNLNYFQVTVTLKINSGGVIRQDNPESINRWIESLDVHAKILNELKVSISQLADEPILDFYTLEKTTGGYKLEIYTKLKNESDLNTWAFLDDYTLWIDESRLKKYIESNFNVSFQNYTLSEEYTRRGDRYVDFTINFKNPIQSAILEKIKNELLQITIFDQSADEEIGLFEESYFQQTASTYISFVVNENILGYR